MHRCLGLRWYGKLLACCALAATTFTAVGAAAGTAAAAPPARKKHEPRGLEQFREQVAQIVASPIAQKGFFGILVADEDTGQTLFDLNAGRYFTPASNTKLFTTTFALATLGPEYRFRTTIETSGTLNAQGFLRGDLVLVGRGDPEFSNRRIPYNAQNPVNGPADEPLTELADAVVAKGVKEIDGDIVADDSYFSYEPYPPGWATGDVPYDYGAAVSAICFDDNGLDVQVTPGDHPGAPASVTVEPWPGYDVYAYDVVTGPAQSPVDFDIVAQPGPKAFLLRGSVPLGHATLDVAMAMPDPALYTASVLKQLLIARGVRVTGSARARHAPPPPEDATLNPAQTPPPAQNAPGVSGISVLAERDSPPLIEIVRVINKVSQNLHAELLLRTVAKEKTGIGAREMGLKLEQNFLTSIGVPLGDVLVDDGSGLSRENLVTPNAVVALLEYTQKQPWGAAFLSTLPVAGVDGTLDNRMKGTPAQGRVHGKTGSVEHTQAVSGFATTVAGEHLVFSMFDNHNGGAGRDAAKFLDEILNAMVTDLGAQQHAAKRKHR